MRRNGIREGLVRLLAKLSAEASVAFESSTKIFASSHEVSVTALLGLP